MAESFRSLHRLCGIVVRSMRILPEKQQMNCQRYTPCPRRRWEKVVHLRRTAQPLTRWHARAVKPSNAQRLPSRATLALL